MSKKQKLNPSFYSRKTETVARELLGKVLVHKINNQITAGIITETEAYLGIKDRACHTFGGRRTPRVESMYKEGGHSYVYFIYGIHFCFNVVTRDDKNPEAVLIRALHPVQGLKLMRLRRKMNAASDKNLCSGPGKLCQAMGIGRAQDGLSLQGSELWIEESIPFSDIKKSILIQPRVGIDYAQDAVDWPLRFTLKSILTK